MSIVNSSQEITYANTGKEYVQTQKRRTKHFI